MQDSSYWNRALRRMNRRGVLQGSSLAAAAAMGGLLVGCGDDDSSGSKTASPATSGAATAAGSGTAAASAAASAAPTKPADISKMSEKEFLAYVTTMPPKDFADSDIKTGGTPIRQSNATAAFDFHAASVTSTAGEMVSSVYSKLMRFNNTAGALKTPYDTVIEGDLAQKWEQPDSQTVIVTLNPNIKWQNVAPLNGRPFTVADIQYSFNRGATFDKSVFKPFFQAFSKIEDVGNNQVKLTLAAPDPSAIIGLVGPYALIMPKEIGDNPDTANTKAVGTGGFIMDKFTPNVEVTYKRNPEYFKKDAQGRQLPYIDGYTNTVITDTATVGVNAEAGKIDLVHQSSLPVSADQAFDFAKRIQGKGINLVGYRFIYCPFSICGHYQQAPWSDPRVRQAISNVIDRPSINESFFRGLGADGIQFPFTQVFDSSPTLDQLGPNYKYDIARAKQLLSAAGQSNLTMNFHWQAGNPVTQNVVELFVSGAKQAGITINLVAAASSAAQAQKQSSKTWDGLLYAIHGLNYPDFMAVYPIVQPNSPTNFGDVNNQKYVDQFNRQRSLLGDARKAVLKETYTTFLDDMPLVPFTQRPIFGVYRDRFKNWRDNANATPAVGLGLGSFDEVWLSS